MKETNYYKRVEVSGCEVRVSIFKQVSSATDNGIRRKYFYYNWTTNEWELSGLGRAIPTYDLIGIHEVNLIVYKAGLIIKDELAEAAVAYAPDAADYVAARQEKWE